MNYPIVALAIAFALGAAVVFDAYRLHPVACVPVTESDVTPTGAVRSALLSGATDRRDGQYRETFALTHPLRCEGAWIKNCADFAPCKESCL